MVLPPTPAGQAPRRPRLPEKLDTAILSRFVLQTFGRARRTQDSPVVPDVWLRFIGIAETAARAAIEGGGLEPQKAVDLLLTPWSGSTPGHIAESLRKRLRGPDGDV